MAIKRKIDMQGDVFEGISAVFLVKNGIVTTAAASTEGKDNGTEATIKDTDVVEAPVSNDSGFDFNGGTPSISHFKIHGFNADWASKFTPGDGEIKLEIPTEDSDVLDVVYGTEGTDVKLTLPDGVTVGGKNVVKGKARSFEQKAVYLGLLILNDTEDKLLFIKKGKFIATPAYDGGEKPYAITLTGTLAAGGDKDAYGILEPVTA